MRGGSVRVIRVLFRAAAGPSIGFGHLVRSRSIARALGVIPTVSIRGSVETRATAAARGFDVRHGGLALLRGTSAPDVLIIDDPSAEHASRWSNRARSLGIATASVHDAGLAYIASDLLIDGSLTARAVTGQDALTGPAYAALDPSIAAARAATPVTRSGVLIALGGGEQVRRWGAALASAVLDRCADTQVRIAAGFTPAASADADTRVTWVSAPYGLADELRHTAVVVVGGGITLCEAAALGAPSVAVAVVPAQRAAIEAFAALQATCDGGLLGDNAGIARVADAVAGLLAQPERAREIAVAGSDVIDGRGVFRVADAVRQLARRAGERRHAA